MILVFGKKDRRLMRFSASLVLLASKAYISAFKDDEDAKKRAEIRCENTYHRLINASRLAKR